MNLAKSIIKFILTTAVIGGIGLGISALGYQVLGYQGGGLNILGIFAGTLFLSSPIIAGLFFYRIIKKDITDLKQKNLLKRRFHGKRKIIDETGKHHADLTRDLNKSTDKDTKDEILAEFFAGIGLDMNAIKFSEAKEIALEELEAKK